MKIFINDQGDRTVGINPYYLTIDISEFDIKDETFNYEDNREKFRKLIREVGEFLGMERAWGRENSINVVFEDECPDCFCILKDNKCINKNCISNMGDDKNDM